MIPLPVLAAVIAAGCIASFVAGWQTRSWKADAADKVWMQELDRQRAQQEVTARELVAQAQKTEVKTRVVYRTIRKEIPRVTSDAPALSADAVGLWNAALAGSEPLPENSAGAAGPTGAAAAAATDEDVLSNAVDNFEICNRHIRTLNAIREWDRKTFGERGG